ncbi:MAG: primosomal protein N', partial [Clostridiales bacterium]|nr:primosomal protein N' [Clostridiales bacterium]
PEIPYELITEKLHISAKTIESFVKEELICVTSHNIYRNPMKGIREEEHRNTLSQEQKHIVETVLGHRDAGIDKNYLIKGITGSGKTEVYMELIESVIEKGQQAIMLIPEIALTYQTVLRFYKRFGDRVSVMNSKLSPGERFDQTQRAKNGEIDIMIGPRSALFTPFSNIGIIIIDEEHENSYKSETMPRYHAREIAFKLATMHKASVVLGSATPSLESYYMAKAGEIELLELTKRLTGGMLPKVYIEDLRKELKEGNRSIFSNRLQALIQERLDEKQQIMLFLNRRGYAGFVSCRACGHVMKCPHCDVSLSEHKNGKLICHYCGFEMPGVKNCPECNSKYILGFRAGTQQLEELIQKTFPRAAVLRMDADTTRKKGGYYEILSAFSNGEADILVGTQMIVKGHDFPNVTLVGILAADLSLAANDYRAAERTFQLLTQAAGRAGRGVKPGEVVIQTYQPEHYSIVHASNQDYDAFYEEEILYRSMLKYPPVSEMLAVLVNATDEARGKELIHKISETIKPLCYEKRAAIIGPAFASIGKINDIFRFILYVKHPKYDMLVTIKNEIEHWMNQQETKNETVQFDFNPMNGY